MTNERPIFLGLVRYPPPPHLVWWWGRPHFHNEAPSTGVAERRAGLVRWAPHMGEWPVPPLGRGGKCTPFFQPGGQNPPPHPTLTSLPGLIAHLLRKTVEKNKQQRKMNILSLPESNAMHHVKVEIMNNMKYTDLFEARNLLNLLPISKEFDHT